MLPHLRDICVVVYIEQTLFVDGHLLIPVFQPGPQPVPT